MWRHRTVCQLEADPQPTLAFFIKCAFTTHSCVTGTELSMASTEAAANLKATADDFGSYSNSLWLMAKDAALTDAVTANPDEVLPCSISSLRDNPVIPDAVRLPVRHLLFFVKSLVAALATGSNQITPEVRSTFDKHRPCSHAQYGSMYTKAVWAQDDVISRQLLERFISGNISPGSSIIDLQPEAEALAAGLLAEQKLPAAVKRAVHCLRSVLLTLKLASLTHNKTHHILTLPWTALVFMHEDLAATLEAFGNHMREAAHAESLSASPSVVAAEKDILIWSQQAVGLLLSCLGSAVKQVSQDCGSIQGTVALSCLGLMDVLLHNGTPQAMQAVGQALYLGGICHVYASIIHRAILSMRIACLLHAWCCAFCKAHCFWSEPHNCTDCMQSQR